MVPLETQSSGSRALRLSVIMEWANTRLNGVPRVWRLVDALAQQWQALVNHTYPENLPPEAARFLEELDHRPELLVASGEAISTEIADAIRARLQPCFTVEILVAEGLEYYPLKNHAAAHARGDLMLFIDSDVVPDADWLVHLLGSFSQPEVAVVCGQTYIAPTDLVARAFALGWTYLLRDPSGMHFQPRKTYANNIAFRADVFRQTGFPEIGQRTRGAVSLLRQQLDRIGVGIWENRLAGVDHPPPASVRHMIVRGLAHGRDHYMKRSEQRSLFGLGDSLGIAAGRLGRSFYRTFRDWRRVGLRAWEIPAALAICSSYYACFALGGVLTHLSPAAMGRRFRV